MTVQRVREAPEVRRCVALAPPAALLVAIALSFQSTASGRPATAAAQVIDRTLSCSTISLSGRRFAGVGATPASRSAKRPARASVTTGRVLSPTYFAYIEAGPAAGRGAGSVNIGRTRCSRSRRPVPLTRTGLPGPPNESGKGFRCRAGRRVLVRLRAVLDRPVKWQIGGAKREFTTAKGDVARASIAVRTDTGKPLAFMSLRSGNTTLFAAPKCVAT
jgi:hypothetical protein